MYFTYVTKHYELLNESESKKSGPNITFSLGFSQRSTDSFKNSPCLNFFTVFLSNLLQQGASKVRNLAFFRLTSLKFLSFVLQNPNVETINAGLLLLANTVESKLLKGHDLETILDEFSLKIEQERLKNQIGYLNTHKQFSKLVIWCTITDGTNWNELGFGVVSRTLPECYKLGKSLLQLMVIYSSWSLKSNDFASNSTLHELIKWCFANETLL